MGDGGRMVRARADFKADKNSSLFTSLWSDVFDGTWGGKESGSEMKGISVEPLPPSANMTILLDCLVSQDLASCDQSKPATSSDIGTLVWVCVGLVVFSLAILVYIRRSRITLRTC